MALLTVKTTFRARHGTRDVQNSSFIVRVTVSGAIRGDFVCGVDDVILRKKTEEVASSLHGNWLDDVVGRATLEMIAAYFVVNVAVGSIAKASVELEGSQAEIAAEDIDHQTWHAELAFRKGVSLLLREKASQALLTFTSAIELAPIWSAAYNARGRCYRRLGEPKAALNDYEHAIELDQNFGEAHRNKANILLELGRTEEALASFNRAVELLPQSALAFNNRGFAFQQAGEYERAIPDHQIAVNLDPKYSEAFEDLASALKHVGKSAEAEKAANEAVRLQPFVDKIAVERSKLVHVACNPDQITSTGNPAKLVEP